MFEMDRTISNMSKSTKRANRYGRTDGRTDVKKSRWLLTFSLLVIETMIIISIITAAIN